MKIHWVDLDLDVNRSFWHTAGAGLHGPGWILHLLREQLSVLYRPSCESHIFCPLALLAINDIHLPCLCS